MRRHTRAAVAFVAAAALTGAAFIAPGPSSAQVSTSVQPYGRLKARACGYVNLSGTPIASATVTGSPAVGSWRLSFEAADDTAHVVKARNVRGGEYWVWMDDGDTTTALIPGVTVILADSVAATDDARIDVYDEVPLLARADSTLAVTTAGRTKQVRELASAERAAGTYNGASVDVQAGGYCAASALVVRVGVGDGSEGSLMAVLQVSPNDTSWATSDTLIAAFTDTVSTRCSLTPRHLAGFRYARVSYIVATAAAKFEGWSAWSTSPAGQ